MGITPSRSILSRADKNFQDAIVRTDLNLASSMINLRIDPNAFNNVYWFPRTLDFTYSPHVQIEHLYVDTVLNFYNIDKYEYDLQGTLTIYQDSNRITPLHLCAILAVHNEMAYKLFKTVVIDRQLLEKFVILLLKRGANPNLVDVNLSSPLHYVAKTNDTRFAQILIDHNASLNMYNKFGQSPKQLAGQYDNPEMKLFLKDYRPGVSPQVTSVEENIEQVRPQKLEIKKEEDPVERARLEAIDRIRALPRRTYMIPEDFPPGSSVGEAIRKRQQTKPSAPDISPQCIVCENIAQYRIKPCGHQGFCGACCKMLTECPMCSKAISEFVGMRQD